MLTVACAPINPGAGSSRPDATIEISSGPSLLVRDGTVTQGLLSFRGLHYLTNIKRGAEGACACEGRGKVYNLDSPREIGGTYLSDARGKLWRNEGGVEIEMNPPIAGAGKSFPLKIDYLGPALPRQ